MRFRVHMSGSIKRFDRRNRIGIIRVKKRFSDNRHVLGGPLQLVHGRKPAVGETFSSGLVKDLGKR